MGWLEASLGVGGNWHQVALQSGLGLRGRAGLSGKTILCFMLEGAL